MDFTTLVLFLPACFALNMVPGPNNLLSMSNAQQHGFQCALVAGLGRITAFVGMILLAATGLATVLYASKTVFLIIKILGALYLFWVAYKLWTSDVLEGMSKNTHEKNAYQLVRQEFLLAAGNPKAILIFTAFLPQFINPLADTGYQFFILGMVFLGLELLAISIYSLFGVYLSNWFSKPNMKKLFNRSCAFIITTIGIELLVSNEPIDCSSTR